MTLSRFLPLIFTIMISQVGMTAGLKVLTLNFNAETTNMDLKNRRIPILENHITENDLDVVVIQECWDYGNYKSVVTKLAQDLNMDSVYNFEDGVAGIRVTSLCMLTKKSLDLRNIKIFKLPHSAPTIGDGQNTWVGLGAVNMLIGGEITLASGQNAFFWTAHLNNASSANRLDQVKFAYGQMQAAAQAAGEDPATAWIFFAGDLNSEPNSPEQTYLRTAAGFQDMWLLAHPNDPGTTSAGDLTDPEYNPMVHGAGLFPSQYAPETSQRIDYVYARLPQLYGVAITRTFTSPVNNTWMSDHFGLSASFDFTSGVTVQSPSADSDFSLLGPTTVFTLSDGALSHLPWKQDFNASYARGFTLVNIPNVNVQFFFTSGQNQVYTEDNASPGENEEVSFSFFSSGDYKYRMIIRDYRHGEDGFPDYSQDPVTSEMDGIIHVK